MIIKASNFVSSRRQFLNNVLPAGTLFCFGCSKLLAWSIGGNKQQVEAKKHKFLLDSGMTVREVFDFAFLNYILVTQNLVNAIGKDEFIEMLKKASSDALTQQMKGVFKDLPRKDLVALSDFILNFVKMNPYKNALTYEIIEKTDKAFELKYTECLFAKTFRESNAPEIGYAAMCYPDYAFIRAFNPKMEMIRTKTLMQGDDCCNPRVVWKG